MKRIRIIVHTLMILFLLGLSASIAAKERNKEPAKKNTAHLLEVIWRDPGNIQSLNLL